MKEKGCYEKDCKNKFFKMGKINPFTELPLCRKHWYMYNYGYGEYEASKK